MAGDAGRRVAGEVADGVGNIADCRERAGGVSGVSAKVGATAFTRIPLTHGDGPVAVGQVVMPVGGAGGRR
jgi:hypothetical protein